MIGETIERVATIAFGLLFELIALDVYWQAAEAAEPVAVVASLLLAAGGLALIARASDRLV